MIIFLVSFISLFAFATPMNMKPGLWEVDMKISTGGKEMDPMAEVKKQLAKMPEAQRKMVMEQMGKISPGMQDEINRVCFTKEMLNRPEKLSIDKQKDCEHKIKGQSSKKMVMTFKCKDGQSGTTTWELKSPTEMTVLTDSISKDGKKTQMNYQAKFIKDECSHIK